MSRTEKVRTLLQTTIDQSRQGFSEYGAAIASYRHKCALLSERTRRPRLVRRMCSTLEYTKKTTTSMTDTTGETGALSYAVKRLLTSLNSTTRCPQRRSVKCNDPDRRALTIITTSARRYSSCWSYCVNKHPWSETWTLIKERNPLVWWYFA